MRDEIEARRQAALARRAAVHEERAHQLPTQPEDGSIAGLNSSAHTQLHQVESSPGQKLRESTVHEMESPSTILKSIQVAPRLPGGSRLRWANLQKF